MSEHTELDAIIEEIQDAARQLGHRTSEHANRKALEILLRLAWQVQELQNQLQAHQHSYVGPTGLAVKWHTTIPRRDTLAPEHDEYMEELAVKLANRKDRS